MIVAEVTRNLNYIYLTNYAPFVYVGSTKYRTFKTSWGTSADDLFNTGTRIKVKQVARDYLNKYLQEETLAECLAQEGSFYFDEGNQLIYMHVEHDWPMFTAHIDYGYAFGICDEKAGNIYIGNYFYEGVIKDDVDISMSADSSGVSQPKGSSSSISINNTSRYNEISKKMEGIFDFIFSENLYHNDVFIYNYEDNVLIPIAVFYIEDFDISESEKTLNLQDKRFA